jgi:DNA-binding NarL/FixJ family response regulator
MTNVTRIVVVDDHPLFRGGVIHALQAHGYDIVGDGGTAEDAVRLAGEAAPDVMLIDVAMPGCGIAAARGIRANNPHVKIIALTASEDPEHVSAMLECGANGYVLKGVNARELVRAIESVRLGDSYVTPRLAAGLFGSMRKRNEAAAGKLATDLLTKREEQILSEVALGRTNKEIAYALSLSEKTVKHYITSILDKLQVRNRVEAALAFKRDRSAA